jgi:Transcriptional regulatory protein, C terminal
VTRTMILEHVWNSSFEGLTNVVDVYISALRSKVDRDFPQKLIQTNRGIGYTFTCVTPFPQSATAGQVDPANRFPVASVATGELDKRRILKGQKERSAHHLAFNTSR